MCTPACRLWGVMHLLHGGVTSKGKSCTRLRGSTRCSKRTQPLADSCDGWMSALCQGVRCGRRPMLSAWITAMALTAWQTPGHGYGYTPARHVLFLNSSSMLIGSGTAYTDDRRQRGSGPRSRDLRAGGQRQLSRRHSPVCASILSLICASMSSGRRLEGSPGMPSQCHGAVPCCVRKERSPSAAHAWSHVPTFGTPVQTSVTLPTGRGMQSSAACGQNNHSLALTPPP